ncbi:hypothetical protein O181_002925 [Austropuccinia psidii MF-1]|uniref:Uncharacterized protein n=1 Tax=Austropuccinia psidii MF-1 TaxID=1389203 RepID=A0A9Q3GDC5_9BASI|nr:hypothetical protein [Austropuccinia psidii MF-1]
MLLPVATYVFALAFSKLVVSNLFQGRWVGMSSALQGVRIEKEQETILLNSKVLENSEGEIMVNNDSEKWLQYRIYCEYRGKTYALRWTENMPITTDVPPKALNFKIAQRLPAERDLAFHVLEIDHSADSSANSAGETMTPQMRQELDWYSNQESASEL